MNNGRFDGHGHSIEIPSEEWQLQPRAIKYFGKITDLCGKIAKIVWKTSEHLLQHMHMHKWYTTFKSKNES